jgi:hypothetical protein
MDGPLTVQNLPQRAAFSRPLVADQDLADGRKHLEAKKLKMMHPKGAFEKKPVAIYV